MHPRPLTVQDLDKIRTVLGGDDQWLLTHSIGHLDSQDFLLQTGNVSTVSFHGDDGFLLFQNHTEIYFAYVKPAARKKGILTQMLAPLKPPLHLEALSPELIAFWEHLGFKVDSYQPAPEQTTLMSRFQ